MNDENIKGIENSYRRELHHTRSAWIEPCNGAEVFEKAFPNLYQTGLHSLILSARIIEKEVEDTERTTQLNLIKTKIAEGAISPAKGR